MKYVALLLAMLTIGFAACQNGNSTNAKKDNNPVRNGLKQLNLKGRVKMARQITFYNITQKFGDWVIADSSNHLETTSMFDERGFLKKQINLATSGGDTIGYHLSTYNNNIVDTIRDFQHPEKSIYAKAVENNTLGYSYKLYNRSNIPIRQITVSLNPDFTLNTEETLYFDSVGNTTKSETSKCHYHTDLKTNDSTIFKTESANQKAVTYASITRKLKADTVGNITNAMIIGSSGKPIEVIHYTYIYY